MGLRWVVARLEAEIGFKHGITQLKGGSPEGTFESMLKLLAYP